ncbi:MAG: nodulation protein NfeD [Desulfobacterales bacterium]|nr:nodulation protein NfeD [Desulfobacterales bacterium]
MKPIKLLYMLFAVALVLLGGPETGFTRQPEVYVIRVSSAISPGTADYLKKGILQAAEDQAALIIIELDTPGGLAESMRNIEMAILGSLVPVAVYVAPAGARAASAGVMITMAADIAAMAPGTNIGAAHPVGIGGKKIDKTMADKVVNDMVAHAKSVAEKRGRNAAWVEKAIRESVSVTETEALKENIIDVIATDMDDLIRQINGRTISGKGVLKLDGAKTTVLEEGLRTKILKTISDPNIAYILMMIGIAGIYFELSHPGAIFPGVIGAVSLVLAFFAFQTLPVNYAGFLLILLAVVFFIMEMKITSYGLLSVAGVLSFLLGSIMLFEGASPELRVAWRVMLPTLALVCGFFVVVAGLVFKSQTSRPRTGSEGLVGETGVVKERLEPEGKVQVHGELWKARSAEPIGIGVSVRVVKVENLIIEVEPLKG